MPMEKQSWEPKNKRRGRERRRATLRAEPDSSLRLVALGDSAVPHLRRAVEKDEYSFHLIEALEQLTGEEIGLR